MARELTPKQEEFAQHFHKNGDGSAAYRHAYSASRMSDQAVAVEASRLIRHPKVSLRIKQLRDAVAEVHDVTTDSIIAELEEARQRALRQDPTTSAAVSASMGKAKLAGLVVDKSKVQADVVVQELPPLAPLAAIALKEKLEAERF